MDYSNFLKTISDADRLELSTLLGLDPAQPTLSACQQKCLDQYEQQILECATKGPFAIAFCASKAGLAYQQCIANCPK